MKMLFKIVAALVVIVIAAVTIGVVSFDVNAHREKIADALSKQTGRTVKLGGDIHIGFSMKGLTLSIRDVGFGNPEWASRPTLAGIGLFELDVGLLPLLQHQVVINSLSIDNADILLESASGNRHNWDMPTRGEAKTATADKQTGAAQPVALQVNALSIKDSRIAVRGEDGKLTVFQADKLTLGREGAGMAVHFGGNLNDLPIKLAVLTNADALTSQASRPVDLDLTFANYHLTAKGKVDIGGKKADFASYELASGGTKIAGHMLAAWGGARPAIQGSVNSDHLVPADLKMATKESAAQESAATPAAAPQRLFSNEPLNLAGLKAADVNLDLAIGSMPAGTVQLDDVKTKLVINNGHLFLSPIKAALGKGAINGQINLDASGAPARLGMTFNLNDIDLGDLIKAGGAEAFITGKVKADTNLASNGNSLHDLASNLSGTFNVIGAGGDVLSSASSKLAAGIESILSPGGGSKNDGVNCLVARFIASNGIVKGNGILVDTGAATAAGYGDIDLRSETINLEFHAKSKMVNTAGLLPPAHIGGTLLKPDVSFDAARTIQNLGNMLLGGGEVSDPVPDLATQQGQNACAYTLDHPTKNAAPAKGGVVQDLAGKAGEQLKKLNGGAGGDLIKGLFGQ